MHHRSVRGTSAVLFVLAAGCGGGDFVSNNTGGSASRDGGNDGSTGALSGSGGTTAHGGASGSGNGATSSSGGTSPGSGGSDGSGGTPADGGGPGAGGSSDAGAGGASSGGTTDTGGTAGTSGGGSDSGGAGGVIAAGGVGNGGSVGAGGVGTGGVCQNPTMWYVDSDQDGFGSTAVPPIASCVPPPGRFTKVGGDCNDSNTDVHPQLTADQQQYFAKPYQTPGGVDSFDYDCSGHEDGDPGQTKAASMCPAISLGACGGSGYLAVSTSNRIAANGYCGSRSYQTCTNSVTFCSPKTSTNSEAYRCK